METKKTLEEVKKLNKLKDKECIDAWVSVKELQNELMRKSMHVGSLGIDFVFNYLTMQPRKSVADFFILSAFAVEGQVKEKSNWFMSLQEVAETLKARVAKEASCKK